MTKPLLWAQNGPHTPFSTRSLATSQNITPDPVALAALPAGTGDATAAAAAVTETAEVAATLLIGDFATICSNCRKPTLLHGVSRHTDISGWNPKPGGGCGARYVNTAPLDGPISAERLKELRPDLPVRGLPTL